MLEDLSLLAALLRPRDIALHPNFRSAESVSVASLLALLTTAQRDRYLQEIHSQSEQPDALRPEEISLLDSVLAGMTTGTVQEGAMELAERSIRDSTGPIEATVSAVLSSSFYAELGQHESSVSVLSEAAERVSRFEVPSQDLLMAVITQNIALRRWDKGEEGNEDAQRARASLQRVTPDQLPSFQLSRGVSWSSSETLSAIHHFLIDANEFHFVQVDKDWKPRLDMVRQAANRQVLQMRSRIASALSTYLEHSYRSSFNSGLLLSGPDGDEELSEALMHAEFNGHLAALYIRRLLGALRYTRGRAQSQDWKIEESLRLFRSARSKKDFEYASRRVRVEGPLRALRNQSVRFVAGAPQPSQMDELDFLLLEMSAELLEKEIAEQGLELALLASKIPRPQRGRAWESSEHRFEYVWRAAIVLARRANRESDIAVLMLDAGGGEPVDFYLARLIRRLDDSLWRDEAFRGHAVAALQGTLRSMPETCRAIQSALTLSASGPGFIVDEGNLDLRSIAELLNLGIVQNYQIPDSARAGVVKVLRETMRKTREQAKQGVFSAGALPECELAIVYGLGDLSSDIWADIAEYLLDPVVQRSDKTAALQRLVRHVDQVPSKFLDRLRSDPSGLLRATSGFFNDAVDPYPEAVHVIATFHMLPNTEVMVLCGRLLSSSNPDARAEGARALQFVARHTSDPDWLFSTAIGASFDPNYLTRAEAAATLAYMRRNESILLVQIDHRLAMLLGEDGTRIPLLALLALRENEVPLSSALLRKVKSMAASHIHHTVRAKADQLLNSVNQ